MSERITIEELADAVAATLGAAAILIKTQSFDELGEGIEPPQLQVYPEEGTTDPSGQTDRTTFKAGARQKETVIHADFYASRRANLAEDIKRYTQGTSQLNAILDSQDTKPYFGLLHAISGEPVIKAFSYTWKRQVFRYGTLDDKPLLFMGARFIIKLRTF